MREWLQAPPTWETWLGYVVASLLLLGFGLFFVTYSIFVQRKLLGWMQSRVGPNRVGPWGLLQTVADTLKLLVKENVQLNKADRVLFIIAPIIAFVPAFVVLAVIPYTSSLVFSDFNVGLLLYFGIAGLSTLGVITGGWASNNKWSLIGAMRAAAMMISYEIPLVLAVLGVVLLSGSLNLSHIVEAQARSHWFILPQILGFVIFFIASLAELNRTPFDFSEAESELIAGYQVEYSGFRFAFFMLGEYLYLFAMGSLTAVLYFGGWLPPHPALAFVPGIVWFLLKALFFAFVPFWLQATLPRMRIDLLMTMSWKVLLPLALVNLALTVGLKTISVA
ncbi:NADH-quinone oxidoreductase subunit NuoH [Kyrpidia tusciae]|uniref:NADH-quinone oxidoreductase subunit H n=1 Tax=Kyrpidia tusciae (strain DSM 2912 / NBRC 15312 / T2) TaxID=562970 RepID=D5WV47_KYRT2|nr:NADH-quinone oxidoreductase subunit NuoH [Kyrpidia tusciae]ADG07519.1 NADH dehydrogenase (quinone) [Kyrpidia tusciae DSM 2912]